MSPEVTVISRVEFDGASMKRPGVRMVLVTFFSQDQRLLSATIPKQQLTPASELAAIRERLSRP